MGAIFICLKNTFQRHFGKLYAPISHIVVEYLRYSGTIELQLSLNEHHIQAQQIVPHVCQQTVCQLPTIYTIAIKAPQFCNAHFTLLHHTFYNSATHKPQTYGQIHRARLSSVNVSWLNIHLLRLHLFRFRGRIYIRRHGKSAHTAANRLLFS